MVSHLITVVAVVLGIFNADAALISYKEFRKAVVSWDESPTPSPAQYQAFIRQMPNGNITSKIEAAMFLSQVLYKTTGLRKKDQCSLLLLNGTWVHGFHSGECPGKYDRKDGAHGKYYYGRGYIQMAHSYNYKYASLDLYNDLRLINDPEIVVRDEDAAWGTAFWFWKANVHNRVLVQKGFFGDATKVVFPHACLKNEWGVAGIKLNVFNAYTKVLKAFKIKEKANGRGCEV